MLETASFPKPKQRLLFPQTHRSKRNKQAMRKTADKLTATEKIIAALAEYEYLSAFQITRLLYSPGSLTYVQVKLINPSGL
jgi:hypothetical protein